MGTGRGDARHGARLAALGLKYASRSRSPIISTSSFAPKCCRGWRGRGFTSRRAARRPLFRLMRRRPRGARRLSVRRADRPHCGQRASPQAPLRRGARAYAGAIRRVPAGSPRRDRAGRNRRASCSGSGGRPRTSTSMTVLRARRGGTGSKYVTFRGGLRRAIPFLLVRSGCSVVEFSTHIGCDGSCLQVYCLAIRTRNPTLHFGETCVAGPRRHCCRVGIVAGDGSLREG